MSLGVIYSVIMPSLLCKQASMWSQLEDKDLSVTVIKLFKSLLTTLPPMAYLAAASMRCILAADDESPVSEQCGNPVVPSFMVNVLLRVVWLMNYMVAPMMKDTRHIRTWLDVMVLRMGKIEALEFGLLGMLSSLA
mmetsp:Transcript_11843/g.24227  ORF Transcript_11843/g.24227 Transcript_11843/m.24227 type:complete len:136 (+) Transcript_11843:561-968(+)